MSRKNVCGMLWLLAMAMWAAASGAALSATLADADYNADGNLGLSDYNGWLAAKGDIETLDVWRANFGTEVPDATVPAPVVQSFDAGTGPHATAVGIFDGEFINWTVYFVPDAAGFFDPPTDVPDRGVGTSMAVGFSYEVPEGTLIPSSVMRLDPFDPDDISGDTFPGVDPYSGNAVVEGIQVYQSTSSQLATGSVDAIFLPAGSEWITEMGPAPAMKFTTTSEGDMLTFGGEVAQEIPGTSGLFTLATQTVGAVPEPSTVLLLGLTLTFAAVACRRR